MAIKNHILFLYAETPMHVGTGVGLGAVDMPIQREKHTAYPLIQASGVKGALRDTTELTLGRDSAEVKSIFGGSSGESTGNEFAGALSPSDARILLFPTRALNGVFVWITCPTVLARFKRETMLGDLPEIPEIGINDPVLVSYDTRIDSNQIMLEEYAYSAIPSDLAATWAYRFAEIIFPDSAFWRERMQRHLVILPDNEFRDFVRYSTEVVTRIHIDDVKKTVKDGQLFTQELLPADSVLYSLLRVTDSRDGKKVADAVIADVKDAIGNRMQIGGDETVGRGRVRLTWEAV